MARSPFFAQSGRSRSRTGTGLSPLMTFKITATANWLALPLSGIPEDRTQHGFVISETWATSPRIPCTVSDVRFERHPDGPDIVC